MTRRFVYDPATGRVVEVPGPRAVRGRDPRAPFDEAKSELDARPWGDESPLCQRVIDEALERADRREYSHKRYGDEKRWTET